jgi:hypothetical protein
MFKAVVLELLVKVALVAVQDKQPVTPHLARLGMLIKVLQPLKTEHIIGPAVPETESFQSCGISSPIYHAEMWTRPL